MRIGRGLIVVLFTALAGLMLAGCPGPPAPTPSCPEPQSGEWFGSWQSTEYSGLHRVRGTVTADLTFEPTSVAGTVVVTGLLIGDGTGAVTGTIECDQVTLNLPDMRVTGTIESDFAGWTITGTYTSTNSNTVTTIVDRPDIGRFFIGGPE